MFSIVLFIFGLCISSFLNVAVGREFRFSMKNIMTDRSCCDSCKKTLRWWELIPVLSWIALGGSCARCKARISVFHPVSELLLGVACGLGTVLYGDSVVLLLEYIVVVIVLYIFSVYDIFYRIVPNKLVALVIVVFIGVLFSNPYPTLSADLEITSRIIGAIALSGVFVVINVITYIGLFPGIGKGKQGFGWGDAKLSLFIGLLLGWPLVNVAFWIAVLSGAIVGVVVVINIRKRYLKLPFVPFLAFGCWVALLWGNGIIEWFDRMMFIN